jgi:hypothetical protein
MSEYYRQKELSFSALKEKAILPAECIELIFRFQLLSQSSQHVLLSFR